MGLSTSFPFVTLAWSELQHIQGETDREREREREREMQHAKLVNKQNNTRFNKPISSHLISGQHVVTTSTSQPLMTLVLNQLSNGAIIPL